MRAARFLVSLSLLSLAVTALPAQKALACSCMAADPQSAFAEGNMIFRGTVLGVQDGGENGQNAVAFKVDAVWHGPAVNGVVLTTGSNSAMCGVEFETGVEYTVVANRTEGTLQAFSCGQYYQDSETEEYMSPADIVKNREPLMINNDLACVPYVCNDGTVHASCTPDGSQINYFAAPCMTHGGDLEEGEDETIPGATGGEFTDVPEKHPQFEDIEWARQNGIVQGYADGTFKPNALVNRAEFMKILIGAYDVNIQAMCRMAEFPDSPMSEWYGPYVHAARCMGVVSGYADGTFRPGNTINFVEAAKIIANLDAGKNLESKEGEEWYRVYLDYIQDKEAVPSSILKPDQMLTRADMVQMMYLLIGKELPEEGTLSGIIQPIRSPVEDTGYEYVLVLNKPMRDPLSAMGSWAMVRQLVLVPTETVSQETLKANVGAHVSVSGDMQWGYAESRVFAVGAIAVE